VLAELLVALEPFEAEAFREARAEGRRETFDAYRADALLALARAGRDGNGRSSGPRNTVHVVIDHAALLRGKAEAGERCEVAGGGPVPVHIVRSMMDDAFVTAVVSDGVDVSTVAHLGRRPTAHQRSALEVRDPECVVPSCHVRVGLEIDHVEPWSATRVTKLDALARLCRFHHALKTHEGYRLEGGPGHWRWLKPDGTDVNPRPPPPTRSADDDTGTIAERQARICDAAIAASKGSGGDAGDVESFERDPSGPLRDRDSRRSSQSLGHPRVIRRADFCTGSSWLRREWSMQPFRNFAEAPDGRSSERPHGLPCRRSHRACRRSPFTHHLRGGPTRSRTGGASRSLPSAFSRR